MKEMSEEVDGRDFSVPGNDTSGYIGVSPEYMTYANETERPRLTDLEKWNHTDQLDHLEGNLDEDFEPEDDGDIEGTGEDADPEETVTTLPAEPAAPAALVIGSI
jgi:hypothetical protein